MNAKVVNLITNNRILLPTFASMQKNKEWFASWFDSSYYHSLYAHRDHQEAAFLIAQLIDLTQPKDDATILDVGCGRGRHSLKFIVMVMKSLVSICHQKNTVCSRNCTARRY